jgi:benzoyl-CoA reductase/2-hydroxyglutaryl-CoA dehydratase subunit BcrC/BadD/HgdB
MNYDRLFDIRVSNESVKEWKEQEKKVMGVICAHVPEEILHAADILPIRVRATDCKDSSDGETWMSSLSCSFARSVLQYLMDGVYDFDGLVASDGCCMAGRIFDNWDYMVKKKETENYFLRQIAAPRKVNDLSLNYYKLELNILKEQLEEFTGNTITDEKLKSSVAVYNETRALLRELYELRLADEPVINGEDTLKITLAATSMPKEEFNILLKGFLADAKNRTPIKNTRARLMIIGSALDDPEYIKVIEDKGGLVVADANCFGSRYLWEPVVLDDADIMGSLGKSYLTRPVCPRMIDGHEELHDLILKMAKDYKVDGVIYEKMQLCECWGGESVYLEKKFKDMNIPLLTVEREELMANSAQLSIRAEAFIEMIEKED